MTKPALSIVVSTYNRETLLKQCLESLCAQTLAKNKFEVIIIDNNSTDNTKETAHSFTAQYDNFRYVSESKQGLSYCRNRGIKESNAEYIAFIDDDGKAEPDWAEKIVYSFNNVKPAPSAVGGIILPFYDCQPPGWFKDEYETRTWGDRKKFLEPPAGRYGFSGSNCALKKNIFTKFEGFNSDLGMKGNTLKLGEEADLFFRVYKKHPFFWYDPSIKVYHYAPLWKMKKSYYYKRQYIAGKSAAYIHQADVSIKFLFKKTGELIFYSIKSIYSIVIDSRDDIFFRKTRAVLHKTGYIVESFNILIKNFFTNK